MLIYSRLGGNLRVYYNDSESDIFTLQVSEQRGVIRIKLKRSEMEELGQMILKITKSPGEFVVSEEKP